MIDIQPLAVRLGIDSVERLREYHRLFEEHGKWQISTEGGSEPMWAPSGKELFYRNGEKMMAVTISTEPDLTPGNPTMLFKGKYQSSLERTGFPDTNCKI